MTVSLHHLPTEDSLTQVAILTRKDFPHPLVTNFFWTLTPLPLGEDSLSRFH